MKSILFLIFTFWGSLAYSLSSIVNATDIHANPSYNNKIQTYTLKNGLTLTVKEDHHSPAVMSMVWYRVGSAYEPTGITGISHALEHMMFQGTPKHPQGEFSKIIAKNGGEQNAFTAKDYTAYFQKLDHTLLPLAFELEADRMQNLSLKAENFAKEIQVVREERRMRTDDNPQSLTFERFMGEAYLSTPYHNPVIGWPDDLSHLNIDDLRQWYKTWYAPNNATLVVVGDVHAEEVFKLAKYFFEKIPSKVLPIFKNHQEPINLGPRRIIVKASAEQPMIIMGYVVPTRVTDKKSWKPYALTLLAGILSEGNSSRLVSRLVREKQIASEVNASYDMYSLYESTFLLLGEPTEKQTIEAVKVELLKEIKTLQTTLVSQAELEKVKNQLIAQELYAKDSISAQASDIGMLQSIGLSPEDKDCDLKKLQAITPEQIQEVAKEYLKADHLIEAILEPQSLNPLIPSQKVPHNVDILQGALS